jgi:hypothetical protein
VSPKKHKRLIGGFTRAVNLKGVTEDEIFEQTKSLLLAMGFDIPNEKDLRKVVRSTIKANLRTNSKIEVLMTPPRLVN